MFSSGISTHELFDEHCSAQDLRSRIKHTFLTGFMSDVEFYVGQSGEQKSFKAHRYILGINSAVFHAMFYGSLAEAGDKVFIPDADPEAFGEFLRFIYTEDCSVTEENVMSIVYLATKYIVPALTSKCVKFLGKKVTAESAFELLSQAIHFCADGLEASCWNVIDVDCSNAIKSPAFLKIEHALLCEFLTRETLNVKEVDLFTAIIKWAQFQCESKELEESVENYRKVLGSALNLVRFPTMALEEFASTVVHESKILLQEDIIEIFMQFSGQQPKDTRLPKFSCKPRKHCVGNLRATRFSPQKIIRPKRAGKGWCYMNNTLDALCFKTSRSVKMHGVRAFGDDEKALID